MFFFLQFRSLYLIKNLKLLIDGNIYLDISKRKTGNSQNIFINKPYRVNESSQVYSLPTILKYKTNGCTMQFCSASYKLDSIIAIS